MFGVKAESFADYRHHRDLGCYYFQVDRERPMLPIHDAAVVFALQMKLVPRVILVNELASLLRLPALSRYADLAVRNDRVHVAAEVAARDGGRGDGDPVAAQISVGAAVREKDARDVEDQAAHHRNADSPAVEEDRAVPRACLGTSRNALDHRNVEKVRDDISDRRNARL